MATHNRNRRKESHMHCCLNITLSCKWFCGRLWVEVISGHLCFMHSFKTSLVNRNNNRSKNRAAFQSHLKMTFGKHESNGSDERDGFQTMQNQAADIHLLNTQLNKAGCSLK